MARDEIDALEARTRQFAIDVMHFCSLTTRQPHLRSAVYQLNDAAGSVASNHRAMGRARSTKEFKAKLQIVHEEADEAAHWLLVIQAANRDADVAAVLPRLLTESQRLRNLFGKARSTTRKRFPSDRP